MLNYRYIDFARSYLGMTENLTTENIKVLCLFHDDSDPSMSFHLDKGVFLCFSCGAKGGITKLARKVGLTIIGDSYIEEFDDPNAEWAAFIRSLDDIDQNTGSPRVWSERRLTPYLGTDTGYARWNDRGIVKETVDTWQLGYDRINEHLVIPMRNTWNNKLIGITRRQLRLGAKPKYLDARGFKKSESIFGSWIPEYNGPDYSRADTWVITEGPIDAINVWQSGYNGRAILGGKLTYDQAQLMLKQGVESVVLFFDDDAAGFKKTMSAYGRLKRKFNVAVAQYSSASRNAPSDPGDMSAVQIRHAIENAVVLNTFADV